MDESTEFMGIAFSSTFVMCHVRTILIQRHIAYLGIGHSSGIVSAFAFDENVDVRVAICV